MIQEQDIKKTKHIPWKKKEVLEIKNVWREVGGKKSIEGLKYKVKKLSQKVEQKHIKKERQERKMSILEKQSRRSNTQIIEVRNRRPSKWKEKS